MLQKGLAGATRESSGGCDPILLENSIHAFALLDALSSAWLDFMFKGGTSLRGTAQSSLKSVYD
jgi:hypothetical protein